MSRLIGTAFVVWVIAALAILGPPSVVKGQVPMTGAGLGAPASGPSCTFPTLSGLIAHWRADTGVTTSSGNVTAVAGQNGTSYTLANNGTVPFTASSAYNSHPAFGFVAANTAALSVGSVAFGSGTAASVFIVGQMTSSVASFGGAVVYGVGAGTDFSTQGSGAFVTNNNGGASINSTVPGGASVSGSMTESANHRFGVIVSASATNLYIDGSSVASGAGQGGTFATNGTLVVGNRYSSGSVGGGAWDGPILDVIVSNADETSHVSAIDTWETCQYGS